MEKKQTGIAHDSESSSTISCIDRINIELSKKISIDTTDNELSKEREDELLFGAEEEGDDEDVLSDDSLRLRLSDDEDVEQEDNITNSTNITEFKLKNRQSEYVDVITEKNLCSDIQQIVEEVYKPDDGKLEQKNNSAIKTSQNSTLFLDDTSENKRKQDNICNSENSSMTVSTSTEKCTSNSNKDLEITVASIECSNAASEQHIALGNDNLSTKNHIQINNLQNAEPVTHSNDNLRETISDNKETNATNTCELNKLDNVDSNNLVIDSAKAQVYKSEKLSTFAIIANSDDNNLSEKVVDKTFNDDNHSVKCSFVEINNSQDPKNSIKSENSDNSDLLSHKDYVEHVSKTSEHKDIIQSKDTSKIQPMKKESSTLLIQDQNNLLSIKDRNKEEIKKEIKNEDRNINESVTQIINNNSTSTLQRILESIDVKNSDNEIKSINVTRRKRSKKTINTVENCVEEDKQGKKENGRQKRRTARNAEELIRKKCLNSDSDSSDSSTEQFVPVNHKLNQDIRSASPPSLKRNCSDNEIFNSVKKVKMSIKSEGKNDITKLAFVEKFFQRDMKEKLPKLTQEELEELLIQKIAETITMHSEIGQLREQARISEKYQEVMRTKLQQLTKQVKDFEMVVNRNTIDRRANPDKPVAPIKINRSVGLQVNFITEHGIQSLRQVQQTSHVKPVTAPSNVSSSPAESNNNNNNATRRNGIKTRSPRPAATTSTPTVPQSPIQTAPLISTVTPAALVVAKPLDSTHTLTLSSQPPGLQPILPAPQQQIQTHPQQAIVLNGKIQNQVNRPTVITSKPKNNDLIDLTDEEEKNKSANVKVTAITTTSILEQQLNTPKYTQSFQRVIQTIPTNVVPITQPAIKVITPNQPPATALVNNMNPPRVAYVMQSSTGSPRQVLITSNANQQVQIRPVTTCRPSFSTVTYKTGIANGTVRVLTTPVLSTIIKHPAPLPDTPSYAMTPNWKLPPPAPSLKISKVSNGIVLSWNMNLSDKYADIASYQLYAYQEVTGVNPNTSLWKKVGDVRALPLPMACTLTQFSEGNNYYFAVRAVDTHSRKGQYSIPGNISL
ncbi:Activating transcription factor 7-interacting protein 1 [Camponotus floridanus]|uniref:Activating transcription factor 7-interacting protein 1 n=2 Tax=Camponotus floridanus TaxID=104421 RepID=E2APP2_CAMFO|nr:activating transcription factor 7-interacting protein 1 isoform X2 [Camponotus floridanus]XP_011261817.1 activating transcription factor 7-interacting protein 1 isoform X2 [Camponotus floridanus]EFN64593.1 Activating transcription factor 7-interacting protein 1 [Camponotus floridanus]